MTGFNRPLPLLLTLACSIGLIAPAMAEAPTAPAGPGAQNIALGAKYTLWPAPNYSYCTEAGDATQLTDGKTTTDYFWTQPGTVGWSGAPYAVVTVDLGRVEPIAGASFDTAAGVAGVLWPAAIHLLVSDDGKSYRDVGDLVALDRKAHGPFQQGYAIRRLATAELRTRGRFVQFVVIPLPGCPFIFCDEIEVLRGPQELLAAEPGGQAVGGPREIFERGRLSRGVQLRFDADVAQLTQTIRDASLSDAALRARLLERAAAAGKELNAAAVAGRPDFRAVLPLGDAHAKLFQVQAELWKAGGLPALSAVLPNAWDPVPLFGVPAVSAGRMEVHAMRGEYRAAAMDLYNASDRPLEVTLQFDGLPGGPMPPWVTVHETQWTDTSQSEPVAAALPEARRTDAGWRLTALPGLVRQVWLTVHPVDVPAGEYAGRVVVRAEGIEPLRVPLSVRVWPLEFPRRTTLWLGGWSYTNGRGSYGVNPENRKQFLEHMQSHFVNAPWASASVMMQFSFSPDDPGQVRLDTAMLDDWIAQWPDATHYMVFLAVGESFAGAPMGTPEFDRRVGTWISAWVRHLADKGIAPDRLALLIRDEPNEESDVRPIVAWSRAIRAAEPKVLIWEDPTFRDPAKAPAAMFEACNILCPNRPMWLSGGEPFARFYLQQQKEGRTLQFYSCSGPAKLLDPYSYYRLQAWHAFHVGGTGSYFWAFGDNSGSSSWNEYLAVAGPYTPLFIDAQTITAGKQMEAVRESAEDYEYLVMLRRAVQEAKAAGRSGAAVTEAEAILTAGVADVLSAPGADQLRWRDPKDRTLADALRLRILAALMALKK